MLLLSRESGSDYHCVGAVLPELRRASHSAFDEISGGTLAAPVGLQHLGPGSLGLSVRSSVSQPKPPVGPHPRPGRSEMATQVGSRQRFATATAQLNNGTPVVAVMGDVDLATAPALGRRLLDVVEAGTGEVIVDLTGCSFLDCGGLRALIATRERLERSDRSLALVLSNPSMMRIFQITQLDESFDIHASLGVADGRKGNGNGHV
jgi:anti-sigma B factor antagonist